MAAASGAGSGSPNVDRLIHEPARLAIMTNLFVVESANATYLLQQTGLTWGNLGSHLAKLEDAGYARIKKGYRGKQPESTISLTPKGRTALVEYRQQLLATLARIGE
jgi:DNA-binding MarR family transcriptional regulator